MTSDMKVQRKLMQKSMRTKTENRILLNCNVRTIENWLKENAAEGWFIEKKNGTEFQFKKVKPCQAEFLVLENFFLNAKASS